MEGGRREGLLEVGFRGTTATITKQLETLTVHEIRKQNGRFAPFF